MPEAPFRKHRGQQQRRTRSCVKVLYLAPPVSWEALEMREIQRVAFGAHHSRYCTGYMHKNRFHRLLGERLSSLSDMYNLPSPSTLAKFRSVRSMVHYLATQSGIVRRDDCIASFLFFSNPPTGSTNLGRSRRYLPHPVEEPGKPVHAHVLEVRGDADHLRGHRSFLTDLS